MSFLESKPYIQNEFEDAHWDAASGLDTKALSLGFNDFLEKHAAQPLSLLRANAFAWLLDNAQIQINPHSIFADKLNVGVTYNSIGTDQAFLKKQLNEAGPDIMENQMFYPLNRSVQNNLIPEIYAKNQEGIRIGAARCFSDFRHASPDWETVFSLGFPGLLHAALEEKKKKQAIGKPDEQQIQFYDSVIIIYEAILRYLDRIHTASLAYNIPGYSACIEHLRMQPPSTSYQAMEMSILFITFAEIGYEKVRTLGPVDRLYWPYYRNDLENNHCTPSDVKEMLRFFFMRWHAARRGASQPLGLGGAYPDGTNAANALTYMILDIYEELNIMNPKIHVRCSSVTEYRLIERVAELIRNGHSNIVLINDEAVIRGYEKLGIPRNEAAYYQPMGCYEPFIMGKEDAMICASWLNIAKAVELAIWDGQDPLSRVQYGPHTGLVFKSAADFEKAFFTQLANEVTVSMHIIETLNSIAMKINPSPLLSATMTTCMQHGRDIFNGGMTYSNATIKCFAIATAVDSLLAVKKLVFDEKRISMDELRQALSANWAGFENLRGLVIHDENKYGNHLPVPDKLMRRIYGFLANLIVGKPNNRGGVYRMGADSVDFALTEGAKMGATPDGRQAGEPVSKNLCAVSGMQRRGIIAYMLSVLSLDQADIMGSAPLDFIAHPSAVEGNEGLRALTSMILTYFAKGGAAVHGNILRYEDLKAAQQNPEKYQDLQIRVCGWNDYFVNLSAAQQNEFILQTEAL